MAFDSVKQSSWTLRKTLARKSESHKTFNVAVVGLSGTEKERGCLGSGKSCLCNRFVRPFADDYYTDHISVLSQSDFNSRIVNNDHWLYWGEVSKITEEGVELHFSVIEQTEFIDDACLQPFKSGKMEPYHKRCCQTRLSSGEKLMYICKNQLGIEKEYEQRYLPDGKFNVDGFICIMDVSEIQGRSLERNIEQSAVILGNLMKTKKPVVVATTKNDEASDMIVREVERLVNRKEFRGCIPLIETSAHENVNVDLAFVVCSQLHDRSRGRAKIIPYFEAVRYRKEALDFATDAFIAILRINVTDYRTVWHSVCKSLSINPEFLAYCDLFGQESAHLQFKRHVKRLRDEFVSRKLQLYMRIFPEVLSELLPDLESDLPDMDWDSIKSRLRQHPSYDQFFFDTPPHVHWHDLDLMQAGETRIPWNLMESAEGESCFNNFIRGLEGEDRRRELKQQLKQQLADTGYVTPGKSLNEVRMFLMGRECHDALSEMDLEEVYDEFQREITEIAKKHFQELLLEHSELFYHFASFGPGSVITQDDIFKITEILAQDVRFTALERLEQERMLMLLRHLGFIHGPIREHCPAYPACSDVLIEKLLPIACRGPASQNGTKLGISNIRSKKLSPGSSDARLCLVIVGSNGLGQDLVRVLRRVNRKLHVNGISYSLDLRVIDGDIGQAHHSLLTNDFVPQACLCIYSNHQTLEYVTDSVEKTLLSNLEAEEDRLPFLGLPLAILYAAEPDSCDEDRALLSEEGENRARSLQCPFFDVTSSIKEKNGSTSSIISSDSPLSAGSGPSGDNVCHSFREDGVRRSLISLIDCFQQKSASTSTSNAQAGIVTGNVIHISATPSKAPTPDLRLLVCFLCGDPFDIDKVLQPFFNERTCCRTSINSMTFQADVLDEGKKTIEFILTSYHGAQAFRDELLHGFVLVYSTQRRASLATLSAFSRNIPNTPTQMLGVTDGQPSLIYGPVEQISPSLISEGQDFAGKIRAHFISSSSEQLRVPFMEEFFKDALERKPQIEAAFDLEDSDASLDDKNSLIPKAPSRADSYDVTATRHSEDDYDEVLESEPACRGDVPSPFGDVVTQPPRLGPDVSDNMPSSLMDSAHPADHERLVRPSQLRNRRSLHADLFRRSNSTAVTSHERGLYQSHQVFDDGEPVRRNFPMTVVAPPPYSHAVSSSPPSHPPFYSFSRQSSSHSATPRAMAGDPADQRRPSAPSSQRSGLRRLRHPRPDLLRLRNVIHERQMSLPVAGTRTGFRDRVTQDEIENSNESDDDTLSSGLSGYYPPPPEPAPPDFIPSNYRSHQQDLIRSQEGDDDGDGDAAGAAATTSEDLPRGWAKNTAPDPVSDHRLPASEYPSQHQSPSDWLDNETFESYYPSGGSSRLTNRSKAAPGKLNLSQFDNITDAVGRLSFNQKKPVKVAAGYVSHDNSDVHHSSTTTTGAADSSADHMFKARTRPTAAPRRKDASLEKGSDSESEESSSEGSRQMFAFSGRSGHAGHKKSRKKKSIPVAPPKLPSFDSPLLSHTTSSNNGLSSPSGSSFPKLLNVHTDGSGSAAIGDSISSDEEVIDGDKWSRDGDLPLRSGEAGRRMSSKPALGRKQTPDSFTTKLLTDRSLSLECSNERSHLPLSPSWIDELENGKDAVARQLGLILKSKSSSAMTTETDVGKRSHKSDATSWKITKKKSREDEKQEKRRVKEEERVRLKAEKKNKKKSGSKTPGIDDFAQSEYNLVPLFVEKCITFIQEEGLDLEGIYRVPGNRAHVDLLFQKFDEDPSISIRELDIPVNAVATALKDFFSKRLPPLIPADEMNELTNIASIQDRSERLLALRDLIQRLPATNFHVLKFVFEHFVKITENSKLNSMDSKNLAICWWPTLLPLEFTDMMMFERMRPHLEESVQMMIDQFSVLFYDESDALVV